jgi:uncharacterized protein YjbI with pentapeptide repeats
MVKGERFLSMKRLVATLRACNDDGASRRRREVVLPALVILLLLSPAGAEAFAQDSPANQSAARVESTPTLDPERLSLEKDKLRLERDKLQLETEHLRIDNANSVRELDSGRGWLNLLFGNLTILTSIVLGAWGLYRYLGGRRAELRSSEEERFEGVVKSLGSEHAEERVSASVLLPTFLSPEYERFHEQIFNLAAGHLRAEANVKNGAALATKIELPSAFSAIQLSLTPHEESAPPQSEDEYSPAFKPTRSSTPAPSPSPLAQVLANVLSKSYRLARDAKVRRREGDLAVLTRQSLNAAGVQVDGTYLANVDLRNAWFRQASFRGTTLSGALLTKAVLEGSNMSDARLNEAELTGANLKNVDFTGADLTNAGLDGANLDGANFTGARLNKVQMIGGTAGGVNFINADLTGASFEEVDFSLTDSHRWSSNPELALSLENCTFKDVRGLSENQVYICTMKGAKFVSDEPEVRASKGTEAVVHRPQPSRRRSSRKTRGLKDAGTAAPKGTADAPAKIEAGADESVPQLIDALKKPTEKARREAADALGRIGEKAIPQLIGALNYPNWTVREGAAYALGRMGVKAKECVPQLIHALKDTDSDVRREAADALGRIGEEAISPLVKTLENSDESLRVGAAYALGKMGARATESVPQLIEALKDPIKAVRREAADALGEMGADAKQSIPHLTEALNDTDEIVRMNADNALQKIGREEN